MKFKHLFLAALAVASLASCSDDDGPDAPVFQQVDTYLSIQATPNMGLSSKSGNVTRTVADGDDTESGTDREQFINTLTAFVFNEDGSLAGVGKATAAENGGNSVERIEKILVKVNALKVGDVSTTTLQIVLLANIANIKTPATLEELKGMAFSGISTYSFKTLHGDAYKNVALPMSSSIVEVKGNIIAGTAYNNWIEINDQGTGVTWVGTDDKKVNIGDGGKPVLGDDGLPSISNDSYDKASVSDDKKIALTRYVARIQLESLSTVFTDNNVNASFQLKSVAVANVSNASRYFSGENGFQYILGTISKEATSGNYDTGNAFFRGYPEEFERADYYLANGSVSDAFIYDYSEDNISITNSSEEVTFYDKTRANDQNYKVTASNPEMAQFYVFEFNGYKINKDDGEEQIDKGISTLLVIVGDITNNGITKTNRSFRIPIEHTTGSYAVKRNYIYKVNATLTGEGTDNPDKNMLNAYVSFTIHVEDWKVVKQTENDVN